MSKTNYVFVKNRMGAFKGERISLTQLVVQEKEPKFNTKHFPHCFKNYNQIYSLLRHFLPLISFNF